MGFDSIIIDEKNNTILKSNARSFDLSSLGKGYAVDVISDELKNMGVPLYLRLVEKFASEVLRRTGMAAGSSFPDT